MPGSITLAVCGLARPTEPTEPGGGTGQGQRFQVPKVPSPPVILGSLGSFILEGCGERLPAGGPLSSPRRACVRLDSGIGAPDLSWPRGNPRSGAAAGPPSAKAAHLWVGPGTSAAWPAKLRPELYITTFLKDGINVKREEKRLFSKRMKVLCLTSVSRDLLWKHPTNHNVLCQSLCWTWKFPVAFIWLLIMYRF